MEEKRQRIYFSHDADAHRDPKSLALIAKYGFKGYGWFWRILEAMREQPSYSLPWDVPESGNDDQAPQFPNISVLSFMSMLNASSTDVERFINDCIHFFKLFVWEDGKITSESFLRRMKKVEAARESASRAGRESARKRGFGNENEPNSTVDQRPLDKLKEKEKEKLKEKENNNTSNNMLDVKRSKREILILDDVIRQHEFFNNDEFRDSWGAYIQKRIQYRLPITERSAKSLLRRLVEISGGNVDAAIKLVDRAEVGGQDGKPWRFFYASDDDAKAKGVSGAFRTQRDTYT